MKVEVKMENDYKSAQKKYMVKLNNILIKVTLILAIPAIFSYIVGQYLDNEFNIKPYGSVIAIFVGLILTWIVLIRMLLKISNKP